MNEYQMVSSEELLAPEERRDQRRHEYAMRVLPALILTEKEYAPSTRLIRKALAFADQCLQVADKYPVGTIPVEET